MIFVTTSDLESVNSADFEDEDSLHELNLDKSKLNVELDLFILPQDEENTSTDEETTFTNEETTFTNEETTFADESVTSSFVNNVIESSSEKLNKKLNEILT